MKNPDGLAVLNAMRLSDAGLAELDRLGPVRQLVKLSESHGVDEAFYVDRYKPEVWAMPDAKFDGGINATNVLGPACPIAGGVVVDFPGSAGWRERAVWIPNGGGTLISCDVLQNHVDSEHASLLARIITPMMGFKGGVIVAPMWRKMQKLQGAKLRQALTGISRLTFAPISSPATARPSSVKPDSWFRRRSNAQLRANPMGVPPALPGRHRSFYIWCGTPLQN